MTKLTLSSLAALGLVLAMQALPAAAEVGPLSNAELRGTQFDDPQFKRYSWGVIREAADGPQVQYTWAQMRRQIEKSRPQVAQSRSLGVNGPISQAALSGTKFDDPQMVRYSWGLLHAPADGPQVQYSWAEIEQQLAKANAGGSARARKGGQPVPADALRGTKFDDPQMVRYSWGLLHVPGDGPQTSYSWAEVNGLSQAFANN